MSKVASRTKLVLTKNQFTWRIISPLFLPSLVGDKSSSQKMKILRDTGATQSLLLDSVLPLTENSFTGANVLISGVEMGLLEVPLHEVNIRASLINGNIVIGMRPSLPVEGI